MLKVAFNIIYWIYENKTIQLKNPFCAIRQIPILQMIGAKLGLLRICFI